MADRQEQALALLDLIEQIVDQRIQARIDQAKAARVGAPPPAAEPPTTSPSPYQPGQKHCAACGATRPRYQFSDMGWTRGICQTCESSAGSRICTHCGQVKSRGYFSVPGWERAVCAACEALNPVVTASEPETPEWHAIRNEIPRLSQAVSARGDPALQARFDTALRLCSAEQLGQIRSELERPGPAPTTPADTTHPASVAGQ